MSKKKSRRQRYIEHWLGPEFWRSRRTSMRHAKAGAGKGDELDRFLCEVVRARFTSPEAFNKVKPC